jgi:CheY-like chemotaxis protein
MSQDEVKTRILVVEDETLIRMVGAEILEDAGFDVLEAADADEALCILKAHEDVLLLFSDIDMPGSMDGLNLARIVHERWPNIRLLLTSGRLELTDAEVPDAGKFISKPWMSEKLISDIRDLIAHR